MKLSYYKANVDFRINDRIYPHLAFKVNEETGFNEGKGIEAYTKLETDLLNALQDLNNNDNFTTRKEAKKLLIEHNRIKLNGTN